MSSRESEQMFTKMADLEKIWQHITCKNEKYHFYFPIAVLNHSNPSNNRDSTHTHTYTISQAVFSYCDSFFSFSHSYIHSRSLGIPWRGKFVILWKNWECEAKLGLYLRAHSSREYQHSPLFKLSLRNINQEKQHTHLCTV